MHPSPEPAISVSQYFRLRNLFLLLLVIAVGVLALGYVKLTGSLPQLDGRIGLRGLKSPVNIATDRFGVPTINAASRLDAYRALGFVTARDRLFQLEVLRRSNSGTLAEIFGAKLLDMDMRQRNLGMVHSAAETVKTLPAAQRRLLESYAAGINEFIAQSDALPFEFQVLGFRPQAWRTKDSILIALGMFQVLNLVAHKERMLSVMEQHLPQEISAFLTPDTDIYAHSLVGGNSSHRPIQTPPVDTIKNLYQANNQTALVNPIQITDPLLGSNAWAVNHIKTNDGRAILANDMHLPLMVPNIWYRANLVYPGAVLSGITLPGSPVLVSGTNQHVAWGFTNALADVLDLVKLEINPDDPMQYRTPDGWALFDTRREVIRIKGERSRTLNVKYTIWGPVSKQPLLGRSVAIRWTALDPASVDLTLADMDRVKTLDAAMDLFNRAGLPVLNVLLADDSGHIGWTMTGRIPNREGYDGSVSRPWGSGRFGWRGYIPPDQLPRVIDPPSGILVSANNRMIGKEYPYSIGQNFANGYRASRIRERLAEMQNISEERLFRLQSDTRSALYDFYRTLALSVITKPAINKNPKLAALKQYLQDWNGRADKDDRAFGVLFRFRKKLASEVLLPLMQRCFDADPSFYYSWFNMDTPLRQLLDAKPTNALPQKKRYQDWDALILSALEYTVARIEQNNGVDRIGQLGWADQNQLKISHPFSRAVPILSHFLDMPLHKLGGCTFCINVVGQNYGVSERLVVSPSAIDDAIFHMPTGQSGHPLSRHYDDQHAYWAAHLPLSLAPGPAEHGLRLIPKNLALAE